MGRMKLTPRKVETIELNIGKILIFCEGSTEKNYFEYFKSRISNKYDNIEILTELVSSNAQAVLNYAENFLHDEENKQNFSDYEKYLVFDCDAPPTILDVIKNAKSSDNEYKLLISSLIFEVWLLMHYEDVEDKPLSKVVIGKKLTDYLRLDNYEKHKNDKGVIAKIIKGSSNVEKAVSNAENLRMRYDKNDIDIKMIIDEKLPFSEVDKLVRQLMIAADI